MAEVIAGQNVVGQTDTLAQNAEQAIDYDTLIKSAFGADSGDDLNYTYDDEEKSRRAAELSFQQNRIKAVADSSKHNADAVSKIIGQVKKDYESKLDQLRNEMMELKQFRANSASKIDKFDERMILDDVNREESQITSDPVIGSMYDSAEIQKMLVDQAGKGRVFSPYEMLAISKFYTQAKELAELKESINAKRELMSAPLFSRPRIDEGYEKRLSNVKSEDEAMAMFYRDLNSKYE